MWSDMTALNPRSNYVGLEKLYTESSITVAVWNFNKIPVKLDYKVNNVEHLLKASRTTCFISVDIMA